MDAKQLGILFKKAKEFAQSQGFNYIKFDCIVNEYAIYNIKPIAGDLGCFGYPIHVIVSENTAPRNLPWDEYCKITEGTE